MSEIKDKYSVGEAARLSNVSTKTLRYYDEIQLIIPDIDENNNYRYYTKDQIQDIITTKKLKNAGLKLNEITDYINTKKKSMKPNTWFLKMSIKLINIYFSLSSFNCIIIQERI